MFFLFFFNSKICDNKVLEKLFVELIKMYKFKKLKKMSKFRLSWLALLGVIGLFIVGCSEGNSSDHVKNSNDLKEFSERLSKQEDFIKFSNNYLSQFVKYSNYQSNILNAGNYLRSTQVESFYSEMSNENLSILEVEQIHSKYDLDFNKVVDMKNAMDNTLYDFCLNNPMVFELDNQDEFNTVIIDAISLVVAEGNISFNDDELNVINGSITADEVWNCAKQAVGVSFISYLSLKGLQMAGAQIITQAITRALTRFAGPIGASILLADFGFCMYGESLD